MKKQKLAVVFAALLTMVGFSSCLNGENDPTVYPQELMKVNGIAGYYTFTSAYGYTITPLNMSALSDLSLGSYAIVQYSYDSSLLEWDESKDVTINNVVNIQDGMVFLKLLKKRMEMLQFIQSQVQWLNPLILINIICLFL